MNRCILCATFYALYFSFSVSAEEGKSPSTSEQRKSDGGTIDKTDAVTVTALEDFTKGKNVVAVPVTADAGVRAGNQKDENRGQKTILEVKNYDDTPEWGWVLQRVFLKFDIKDIDSKKIKSARLCLYGNLGDGAKPVAVELYPIADKDDDWVETKITWNNQPPVQETSEPRDLHDPSRRTNQPPAQETSIGKVVFTFGDTLTRATDGRWYVSSDITKHIQKESETGNKVVSLLLKTEIKEEACLFTKEHPAGERVRPRLVIEMSD